MNNPDKLTSFLLRVGVSLTFFYAATASLLDPTSWIGFMPIWVRNILPVEPLLMAFSIFELILAFWLISGKHPKYSGLAASAVLLAITLVNITSLDIVFRDIGLLAMSLAIVALHRESKLA